MTPKIIYMLSLNTCYLFLNSPYATTLIDRQPMPAVCAMVKLKWNAS